MYEFQPTSSTTRIWHFDGNVYGYLSKNLTIFEPFGSHSYISSSYGQAIQLVSAGMTRADVSDISTGPFTISVLFNKASLPDSTDTVHEIIGIGDYTAEGHKTAIQIRYSGGNYYLGGYRDNIDPGVASCEAQYAFQINTWYNVIMTYSFPDTKIYINGNLLASGKVLTEENLGTAETVFVSNSGVGYTIRYDEAWIENKAWSAAAVSL